MDLEAIDEAIRAVHRGRRWILVADVAAGTGSYVDRLRADGASGVMIVAASEGVGELPDVDRIHYTRASGDSIMDGIRAFLRSVEEPSEAAMRAVDHFDPQAEALVLGQGWSRRGELLGRRIYGSRPRAWRDLEDKTVIDEVWDAAGIERAPSVVTSPHAATRAAGDLATEGGTVWVADNRSGWHGGGEYTRWAAPGTDLAELAEWFAERADRVRVMPFLDGIPCSIHAFVTGDGVAVFLPLELFILRRADPPGFVYTQGGTFWTPPDSITDQMRAAAEAVGTHLNDRLGYLGGFGIDGIATAEGFRPTELNPRLTLGHGIQTRLAEVPLGPMERLLVEGDLEVSASELEARVLEVVRNRRDGGMIFLASGDREPDTAHFRFVADGVELTAQADAATGTMSLGTSPSGSIVLVRFTADTVPVGPPLAPRAAQLMALANAHWDLGLPDTTPAPDPFRR